MKYFILLMTLMLVSCGDDSKKIIAGLTSQLNETTYSLQTCQSRLEMYTSPSAETPHSAPEPEEPSEPEYEEITWFMFQSGSHKATCQTRNDSGSDDAESPACGMTFSDCKDGVVYRCMRDVSYKVSVEKRIVTE